MAENVLGANEEVDLSRRKFLTAATSATGALGVVFAAIPFVASWKPSERAMALGAPTEFDLAKLEAGQMTIITWQKKPIYVVRRTPDMVARLKGHDDMLKDAGSTESEQPDYATNTERSRKADILVLIGTCTHLGCLPKQRFEKDTPEMGTTWPGGWLCPCHGSRFDLAGRVFKGSPASVNLRVPRYSFPTDRKLVIGVDEKGTA